LFRLFLLSLGVIAWALAVWFGTHVSSSPTVFGRWSTGYFALLVAMFSVALLLTVSHASPIYRRIHAVRGKVLAVVLSVLISLAALEGMVRLFDPLGISYYAVASQYNQDKVADPELVYRNPSNCRRTYGGIDFDFNDIALRERPIGPKAAGEFRILFLGDSVVFGSAARIEDTFVRRLEGMLTKRLQRPVRTINSGVGSYNTTQEYGFFKRHGKAIDPDLVVLVYVDNDVELPTTRSSEDRSPPEVVTKVLGYSWLYRLIVHVRRSGDERQPHREEPGWRESMDHIALIADDCRARGIPFVVFLWRYRKSALTDAMWEDLSAIAAAKGFVVDDMRLAFENADFRAITISAVDSHPNPEGHRLAAERIEATLAPLLPPEGTEKHH